MYGRASACPTPSSYDQTLTSGVSAEAKTKPTLDGSCRESSLPMSSDNYFNEFPITCYKMGSLNSIPSQCLCNAPASSCPGGTSPGQGQCPAGILNSLFPNTLFSVGSCQVVSCGKQTATIAFYVVPPGSALDFACTSVNRRVVSLVSNGDCAPVPGVIVGNASSYSWYTAQCNNPQASSAIAPAAALGTLLAVMLFMMTVLA